MSSEPCDLDLTAAAALVAQRALSPVELVESCLARIGRLEDDVQAAPHGLASTGDPVMQLPWTLFGFPALGLPTGLDASGMPLGVQLAAAPHAEAELLAVAAWCERALAVRLQPPLVEKTAAKLRMP